MTHRYPIAMTPDVEVSFSERSKLLKASDVRELLKYTQDHSVISFGGGLPNPEAFPLEELKIIFEELLHEDGTPALQYGPTPGDPLLKTALAGMMRGRGIGADADRIIVTHGAQQSLELLGDALVYAFILSRLLAPGKPGVRVGRREPSRATRAEPP